MDEATEDTLHGSHGGVAPTTSPTTSPRAGVGPSLQRGELVGRYVVLSRLGAGAMGVVVAAYDPELDRKVALKLLKTRGDDQAGARARLQREAQALAKLNHRNVVTVHDVGVHEGRLFLSMEFVEGQTLGKWMAAVKSPRPWRDIVRVFGEAGRGLAAAHEAGMIHRDFKPDNVMLGDDGRVRVMDFGLARAEVDEQEPRAVVAFDDLTSSGSILDSRLTQTGALLGTPIYMSLEQFEGRSVDARSDQFGFCVALYEALYRERPFVGRSVSELVLAQQTGRIEEPPRGTTVPPWLRRVVLRGLATAPEARWPSMQALLDALTDDPAERRRKWWIAVAVVGLLGGGAWSLYGILNPEVVEPCTGMEEKLRGTWDDERQATVEAALLATELSHARATSTRVLEQLDTYTSAWVDARVEACEASERGEQSDELLDLRMACLDERLQHVGALVDVLERADRTVVNKAIEAAVGLPRLERCADVEALRAEVAPPEDAAVAERVATLDRMLVDARAAERAGMYDDALALADAVVVEAETLGYEPLLVRAWLRQGSLQGQKAQYQQAEATYRRALEAALTHRMRSESAYAAMKLMRLVGSTLARFEDGQELVPMARALARATDSSDVWIEYLDNLGAMDLARGDFVASREHHGQALMLKRESLGPEHLDVAASLGNLGAVAGSEGNFPEARDFLERALAIQERALGPDHPTIAGTILNLAAVAGNERKNDEARRYLERALVIRERTLGPEHPEVAPILGNLAVIALGEGNLAEARRLQSRTLAIQERALGPKHPALAYSLYNLAAVAEAEHEWAEARELHQRALSIWEQALGPNDAKVAIALVGLGNVAAGEEKWEEALGYHQRALEIREATLGPEHAQLAFPLVGLGQSLIELGRPSEAIAPLERALAIRSKDGNQTRLAKTQFELADALWEAAVAGGRDRVRARELAEAARAALAVAGKGEEAELKSVDAWLATHHD